jgi:PAS domain S-box-containing protein
VLLDDEWNICEVNPAAVAIIGETAEELTGRCLWDLVPAAVGTEAEKACREARESGKPRRVEYHHEASDRWFDISAYPSSEGLGIYYREITERKQNEAALRRRNEDLTQFTFAATHDLREPLRMITAYAQLLERKFGSDMPPEARSYTDEITGSARRICELLDGLLQFSLAGEGGAAQVQPVSLSSAVEEAVQDLRISVVETGATVSTTGTLPFVLGNHTQLRQVFQNLIGNSIKYRKPGATPVITITGSREGSYAVVKVADNGIGIPACHLTEVFQPFKRLHSAEVAGAGIGLATCKRIVERFGGRIWVESVKGEGSVFSFSLPTAEGISE